VLTEEHARRTVPHAPLSALPVAPVLVLLLLLTLLLGGCTAAANLQSLSAPAAPAAAPAGLEDVVAPLGDYVVVASPLATPTPPPAADEKQYVTVIAQPRANLRSAANTSSAIVAKVNPGSSLEVAGQSENKQWYKVVPPSGVDAEEAWISAELVRLGGSAAEVPVLAAADALLPADLTANWQVDWSCNSDRCEVKQCSADVVAQVTRDVADGYLPVEHTVTWADDCFSTDAWTFEVNQGTGAERSGEATDNFLYGYWLGAQPGAANGVFPLDDERGVAVYCSDPQEVEIEEGGGWTTVYAGHTCHDVRTGMLVYMSYTKRWLFTGDFEGKTYERSYFGDSEKLEQRLVATNAALEFAEKK
jgi:hypothetical protein